MAETGLEALEAVPQIGAQATGQMDLTAMTDGPSREAVASGNLSAVMETAMSGISQMPGAGVDTLTFKDSLTGEAGGDVSREKAGLVSDADVTGDGSADGGMDAMMARYETLYVDMTVFQVAWSIARRVQQDTAQLLRGQ